MASPQASVKLFANQQVQMFDVDADYTTAAVVVATVVDMRDAARYAVAVMTSLLGGNGITLVEIIGCTDSDGTGDITVIKTSGVVAADAIGDYVVEECTAEELAQESSDAGAELRYAALRLTMHHAGDEAVATVIAAGLRFPGAGKTADTIA